MLEPFRGNLWDCVILVLGASGDTGEVGRSTVSHGFEKRLIDGLLERSRLLYSTEKDLDGLKGMAGLTYHKWCCL